MILSLWSALSRATWRPARIAGKASTGYGSAASAAGNPTTLPPVSDTPTTTNAQNSSATFSARNSLAWEQLQKLDDELRDRRISELELEMRYLSHFAGWSAVLILLYFVASWWFR